MPTAGTPVTFPDAAEALVWLAAERSNISAAVDHAAAFGPHDMAWLLVSAVRPYLLRVRATLELDRLATVALAAAERSGDLRAQAAMQLARTDVGVHGGAFNDAIVAATACADIAATASWPEARVAALNALGAAYSFLGDLRQASTHLAAAIEILDSTEVVYRRSATLQRQGVIYGLFGDLPAAIALMERAVEHSRRERAGPFSIGVCLQTLAVVERLAGRLDDAREHIDESRVLNVSVDASHAAAIGDVQLAKILRDCGDLSGALTAVVRAREALEQSTDRTSVIHARLAHATILAETGDPGAAIGLFDDALALARQVGNRHNVAECLLALGLVRLGSGDATTALKDALDAFAIAETDGFRLLQAESAAVAAAASGRDGDDRRAAELRDIAVNLFATTGYRPSPHPVTWLPEVSWP
jgi:tetratricopeptide (TPR) repeat protein